MILQHRTCQGEHTVSDDAFGFWHESWGEPPVHTFPCSEPAVTTVTDPYDDTVMVLCSTCAGL